LLKFADTSAKLPNRYGLPTMSANIPLPCNLCI
jgi:hypothetical protein